MNYLKISTAEGITRRSGHITSRGRALRLFQGRRRLLVPKLHLGTSLAGKVTFHWGKGKSANDLTASKAQLRGQLRSRVQLGNEGNGNLTTAIIVNAFANHALRLLGAANTHILRTMGVRHHQGVGVGKSRSSFKTQIRSGNREYPKLISRSTRFSVFTAAVFFALVLSAKAQTTYTYGTQTSNAFLTAGNWTPAGGPPGAQNNAASLNTDIAQIGLTNSNVTTSGLGINISNASGNLALGSIVYTAGATSSLTIGSSSGTGSLILNGATVGGTANVIVANSSTAATTLTLAPIISGATGSLGLKLGGLTSVMTAAAGNGITISEVISERNAGSSLSLGGGGLFTFSAANAFTGGLTLNQGILRTSSSSSVLGLGALTLAGGELQLAHASSTDFSTKVTGVTVTGNTQITSDRATSGAGFTYTFGSLSIGAQTLTIAKGTNVASGTGTVIFGATNLTGNSVFNVGTGALLTLGNITGSTNTLTMNGGAGSLTLGGTASNTGGLTTVTTGTLNLSKSTGNAIGMGGLTVNGGTATLTAANQIDDSATVSVSSGTLGITTFSDTIGNLTVSGGSVTGTTGVITVATGGSTSISNATTFSAGLTTGAK